MRTLSQKLDSTTLKEPPSEWPKSGGSRRAVIATFPIDPSAGELGAVPLVFPYGTIRHRAGRSDRRQTRVAAFLPEWQWRACGTGCTLLLFCGNERVRNGVNGESDAILHADLPQQLGHMGFHGALPNSEGRPNFLVGAARDQQFQDLLLPVGKAGAAGGRHTTWRGI